MDSFTDKLESVSLNEKSSATSPTQSLDDAQKLESATSLAIASPDTTEGTSMREEAVAPSSTLDAPGKTTPGEDGESLTPFSTLDLRIIARDMPYGNSTHTHADVFRCPYDIVFRRFDPYEAIQLAEIFPHMVGNKVSRVWLVQGEGL
jgi:hypothetical protein